MHSSPSLNNEAGTALIVGGGGGIGRAMYALLRRSGRFEQVLTTRRCAPTVPVDSITPQPVQLDVCDEDSIADAAAELGRREIRLGLIMICTGLLHEPGIRPERRLADIDPDALARLFAVNATGPLLVAKHMLPLIPRDRPAVIAALSARVGSIGDNRLGGWYGYRASKAALNMGFKSLAIELRRSHPHCIAVTLHPGTTDTPLSRPFQRNVRPDKLFSPQRAAEQLDHVISALTPEDSGGLFAWSGERIPF